MCTNICSIHIQFFAKSVTISNTKHTGSLNKLIICVCRMYYKSMEVHEIVSRLYGCCAV
jgi:hypothetical protein